MKDINLFKLKVKTKSKPFILFNIVTVLLIAGLVFVSGLAYLLSTSKTNMSLKLNNLESVNMDLKIYSDRLLAYKKFQDNVEYKANLIENIRNKNVLWSETFYEISKIIPEGVYLNSFQGDAGNLYAAIEAAKTGVASSSKLVAFTINGNATDYIEISKLLINLKNISNIADPWVTSINENIINNVKLLNFSVVTYWDLQLFLKDIKVIKPQQQKTNTDQNTDLNLG